MNSDKVQTIQDFPLPQTRKGLRGFLGLVCWYHNFIERFSRLVEPLYALTSPKVTFKWSPKAEEAFHKLKKAFLQDVVLAHPIFKKPFILRTDACVTGVGASLSQINDHGIEKVVSFASKSFDSAHRKYGTPEQECYAVIYGLNKYREYLEGHEFKLQTDDQALAYLETFKNSNPRLMRWLWKLQEWSPYIQYIKGKDNVVADFWSRNSIPDESFAESEPDYMFPPYHRCNLVLTCKVDRN